MTTTTLKYRSVQDKIAILSFPKINWKLIYFCGGLFLLVTLIFYVFAINELTKGTYLIKKYNKDVDILLQENRILEANAAKTVFLEDLEFRAKSLGFERTAEVKYLQIVENYLGMVR